MDGCMLRPRRYIVGVKMIVATPVRVPTQKMKAVPNKGGVEDGTKQEKCGAYFADEKMKRFLSGNSSFLRSGFGMVDALTSRPARSSSQGLLWM